MSEITLLANVPPTTVAAATTDTDDVATFHFA
jgi:hypothetical protein